MEAFKIDFDRVFMRMPRFYKLVYQQLYNFWSHDKSAFPSQETLAIKCNCCVRTVKRAIAFFKAMGWIVVKKLGWFSNIYYPKDDILKHNPYKVRERPSKEILSETCEQGVGGENLSNCPFDCPHSRRGSQYLDTIRCNEAKPSFENTKYQPKRQYKNPIFEGVPLQSREVYMIQRNFPEAAYVLALLNYKKHRKTVAKPIAYILSMCKKAKQMLRGEL